MARRVLLAAVAVAAATMSLPALAGEPSPGVGVAVQFAGEVVASTLQGTVPPSSSSDSPRTIPGYDAHANCTFAGALLPNNTLDIVYGGAASATAVVVPPRVPQQIIIECRISNEVGNIASFSWTNGGGASAHSDAVQGWPVSPITVCGRAQGFYGPTDLVIVDTGFKCAAVLSGGASTK